MTAKIIADIIVTGNSAIDVALWAAERGASIALSDGLSPADVAMSVGSEVQVLLNALDTLTTPPEVELPERLWVWRCTECGGWHGTVGLPEPGECYGLHEATVAIIRQTLQASARKGSRSAAWSEADFAAWLMGLDSAPSKDNGWPDLDALWGRLSRLRGED